ncbi:MAG TPA: NlpC/P60 family protein [Gaiellaceae bacterium]|jgi:cell wall-associated NlpC family hydrolase
MLAIAAGLLFASQASGSPSPTITATQAQAREVVGEIDALNASLGRSDELVNLANVKLTAVQRNISVNRRELGVARHNLRASRRMIAKRLVNLYTSGSTSTLEVILGAHSLEDVLNRIDTENRVSSIDAKVAAEVARFETIVVRRRSELATERQHVSQLVAERSRQQHAIEVRIGERKSLLSSLNGEVAHLVAAQEAAAQRAARAAQPVAAIAQTQTAQVFTQTPIGATAVTPEGAAVIPPPSHSGVVGVAMGYIGTPYVWAGASPGGFDCSGLVMYAYQQVGVSLPHSSYAMASDGVAVSKDQLQPGDIVFFDGNGHVGIYIGGGEFVHAPHTGTDVQVSSLDEGSYAASYDGARRVN